MTQTILLIDDDACRRKLLGGVLQRRGHGLLFAANGREVASCLEASNCDLLLLDLDMSGESGFDMLDIAVQYRGPVVILTGQLDQCE